MALCQRILPFGPTVTLDAEYELVHLLPAATLSGIDSLLLLARCCRHFTFLTALQPVCACSTKKCGILPLVVVACTFVQKKAVVSASPFHGCGVTGLQAAALLLGICVWLGVCFQSSHPGHQPLQLRAAPGRSTLCLTGSMLGTRCCDACCGTLRLRWAGFRCPIGKWAHTDAPFHEGKYLGVVCECARRGEHPGEGGMLRAYRGGFAAFLQTPP
mmetsp:Transcript_15527/g.29948  ORF Transcript_15527/g.29948 Transcript_15527/m.29948 type:complete len:215 (-) Transcript_15527:98-742(-)